MNLSGYKKIILLGIVLIILAGIFVVALKGVNVSLQLQQHESIMVKVGKAIELKDIKEICNNIFGNKNYIVKNVEMFNDSVDIIVESITDEEKQELVNNINEKYQTELTVENLTIKTNSNVRIRDIVSPFVVSICISVVVIGIIYIIIYRNEAGIINYAKTLAFTLVTEIFIASVITIARIPLTQSLITAMLFIAIAQIMFCMNKNK